MANGVMEELIAALKENTAALKAGGGKAASGAGSKSTSTTKDTSKEDSKPEVTAKDAAKIVTDYLKAGDAAQREAAKTQVGQIVEHFGADRFTTIGDLSAALEMLETFKNGGTPDELASDDGGESLV